jgi:hypothetical protein
MAKSFSGYSRIDFAAFTEGLKAVSFKTRLNRDFRKTYVYS